DARRASGRQLAQAMDPRHPPGIHRSRTLAVLPRGVHLPLQSAHFPQPWARFPEAPRTGSSHRTDHRSERHPWLQLAKISTYVMGGANRLPHFRVINPLNLRERRKEVLVLNRVIEDGDKPFVVGNGMRDFLLAHP